MKIVVGLGNPGEKHKNTKHNAGFMALDFLVQKLNTTWKLNKKMNAEIIKDLDTIYIKPLTYMNNSGQAVASVMSYYKLLPKRFRLFKEKNSDLSETLTVIHDDLDIELGKYKTSVNSRSAGHNGVKSIIQHLKTKNFKRIRIGIKTEEMKKIPTEKYVLTRFNEEDLQKVNKTIEYLNVTKN